MATWLQDVAPRPVPSSSPVDSAAAPPGFSGATLPSMPSLSDEARAPGFASRQLIGTQLGAMPGQYNPQLSLARSQAEAGLAGSTGWRFGTDNPDTPEREDLQVSQDPNAPLGERDRQAVLAQRAQAAARGRLYSTMTDTGIGQALQRLAEQDRQVVTQYAQNLNSIYSGFHREQMDLVNRWTELYGTDALFLAQNPPDAGTPPGPVSSQAGADPYAGLTKLPGGEFKLGVYGFNPNKATLEGRYPGLKVDVKRAGNGKYVAVGVPS